MSPTNFLWYPRQDDLERSNVARLMRRHGISSAAELRERSARDPEWFYPAIQDDLGVEWFRPYERLLDASRELRHALEAMLEGL